MRPTQSVLSNPLFVFYMALVHFLGLVTFPVSTVFIAVFVFTLACLSIKALLSKRYLFNFLNHFCPVRVSPDIQNQYACEQTLVSSNGESQLQEHYCSINGAHLLARLVCLLEIVGFFIRPVSLSLRLVANISCGHILIVLANGLYATSPKSSIHILLNTTIITGVCMLETLVCLVQAYVFYVLWGMYMAE